MMKQGRKRRKLEKDVGCFAGLIDISIPLWEDIFSVVFQYCGDFDYNRIMRSSKSFYELVKERAVFDGACSDTTLLQTFYFSTFMICGCTTVPFELLHRQRFLTTIHLDEDCGFALSNIDLTSFLRCHESGRPHFPKLKECVVNDLLSFSSLDSINLWGFLKKQKSIGKRISFTLGSCSEGNPTEEVLRKVVQNGSYSTIRIMALIFVILFEPSKAHWPLLWRDLDAHTFRSPVVDVFIGEVGLFLAKELRSNPYIKRFELYFLDLDAPEIEEQLQHFKDERALKFALFATAFIAPTNFVAVESIFFTGISTELFLLLCPSFEKLLQKKTLRNFAVQFREEDTRDGKICDDPLVNKAVERFKGKSDSGWTFREGGRGSDFFRFGVKRKGGRLSYQTIYSRL